jgi:hypothetical protein
MATWNNFAISVLQPDSYGQLFIYQPEFHEHCGLTMVGSGNYSQVIENFDFPYVYFTGTVTKYVILSAEPIPVGLYMRLEQE